MLLDIVITFSSPKEDEVTAVEKIPYAIIYFIALS
jgi:hypothetical protein